MGREGEGKERKVDRRMEGKESGQADGGAEKDKDMKRV